MAIPSIRIKKDYKTNLNKSKIHSIFLYLEQLYFKRIGDPNQIQTYYKCINQDFESDAFKLDDFLKYYVDKDEFHVTYSTITNNDFLYFHFISDTFHIEMELELLFEDKDVYYKLYTGINLSI